MPLARHETLGDVPFRRAAQGLVDDLPGGIQHLFRVEGERMKR